jgi:hypothetical protein
MESTITPLFGSNTKEELMATTNAKTIIKPVGTPFLKKGSAIAMERILTNINKTDWIVARGIDIPSILSNQRTHVVKSSNCKI